MRPPSEPSSRSSVLDIVNTLSIDSKAGILDADGNVLKNADIPRKKV